MSEVGKKKFVKRKEASIPWFKTAFDFYLSVLPFPNSSNFLTPSKHLLTKILKTFQTTVNYILPDQYLVL
jgi:hypothetical protein